MPLLKRKTVQFEDSLNKETQAAVERGEDIPLFQVRYTGEVFDNYSTYISRINQYRKHIYTCGLSGKFNLTLEEAMTSERKSRAIVDSFPECYHEPSLRMLHHSTLEVRVVVDNIVDSLKDSYVPGELVEVTIEGKVYNARIVNLHNFVDPLMPRKRSNGSASNSNGSTPLLSPASEQTDGTREDQPSASVDQPSAPTLAEPTTSVAAPPAFLSSAAGKYYNVQLQSVRSRKRDEHKASNQLPKDVDRMVRSNQITRPRGALNKDTLKHFLRENAVKIPYANGPWIVKDALVKKFNLSTVIPDNLREAYEKYQGKRQELEVKEDRKRKREAGEGDSSSGMVIELPLYPMEDLEVPHALDPATPFPVLGKEFAIPQESLQNLFIVWTFLQSFGEPMNLSPFTLDDFESALLHTGEDNPIIIETNAALLKQMLSVRKVLAVPVPTIDEDTSMDLDETSLNTSTEEAPAAVPVETGRWTGKVNTNNWLDVLAFGVNDSFRSAFPKVSEWVNESYFALPVSIKLSMLRFLVDIAVDAYAIHAYLEVCDEKLNELRKDVRELEREKRAAQRQRMEEEKTRTGGATNGASSPMHTDNDDSSAVNTPSSAGGDWDVNDSKAARTLKLKFQKAQRDAEESAKRNQLAKQRDESRKKAAELRQYYDEKKQYELEQSRMQKKLDALYQEIMTLQVQRVAPLGSDRFHNVYYCFDGIGSGSNMTGAGKLFVRSDKGEWGYYQTSSEVEQLVNCLDTRGYRELALKDAFKEQYDRIVFHLARHQKELTMTLSRNEDGKRSTRHAATTKRPPFLQYVNKRAL